MGIGFLGDLREPRGVTRNNVVALTEPYGCVQILLGSAHLALLRQSPFPWKGQAPSGSFRLLPASIPDSAFRRQAPTESHSGKRLATFILHQQPTAQGVPGAPPSGPGRVPCPWSPDRAAGQRRS